MTSNWMKCVVTSKSGESFSLVPAAPTVKSSQNRMKCVVTSCPTNTGKPEERERIFHFPRTDARRVRWMQLLGRYDLVNTPYRKLKGQYGSGVCARHFELRHFATPEKLALNRNAEPTTVEDPDIELHRPDAVSPSSSCVPVSFSWPVISTPAHESTPLQDPDIELHRPDAVSPSSSCGPVSLAWPVISTPPHESTPLEDPDIKPDVASPSSPCVPVSLSFSAISIPPHEPTPLADPDIKPDVASPSSPCVPVSLSFSAISIPSHEPTPLGDPKIELDCPDTVSPSSPCIPVSLDLSVISIPPPLEPSPSFPALKSEKSFPLLPATATVKSSQNCMKCVVTSCPTNTGRPEERERIFHFPRTDTRRVRWMRLLRRYDLENIPYGKLKGQYGSGVCARHFKLHHFATPEKLTLNRNAEPTPVGDPEIEPSWPCIPVSLGLSVIKIPPPEPSPPFPELKLEEPFPLSPSAATLTSSQEPLSFAPELKPMKSSLLVSAAATATPSQNRLKCAVASCLTNTARPGKRDRVFYLPMNETRRMRWLQLLGRWDLQKKSHAQLRGRYGFGVCARHFELQHFATPEKLALNRNAEPTPVGDSEV